MGGGGRGRERERTLNLLLHVFSYCDSISILQVSGYSQISQNKVNVILIIILKCRDVWVPQDYILLFTDTDFSRF